MKRLLTLLIALVMALAVVIGYDSLGVNKTFDVGNQKVQVVAGTNSAKAHDPWTCNVRSNLLVWDKWHVTRVVYLWSYNYKGNHWHRYKYQHWAGYYWKYVGVRDKICNQFHYH